MEYEENDQNMDSNHDISADALKIAFPSPDIPGFIRIHHAAAGYNFSQSPDCVFNVLSRWARYEVWSPDKQGPAHWLVIQSGGTGSRFILYDKPGNRHLAHFGVVTTLDRNRRFEWRAPFSEWQRAYIGAVVEFKPTSTGGTQQETIYFEVREDHLAILAGFLNTPGYDAKTFTEFLEARLAGLSRLLDDQAFDDKDLSFAFGANRVIAADWSGRISEGEWVRVLYADGELDFDGPPDIVFNAFTRFARYADWTRTIHVGAEWLQLKAGGIGSKFLLWEKPGDHHVMHYAAVTELERNRKFTWRALFAEWGKVFIGTSMTVEPRTNGSTHVYHILYADLPVEYLPIFGGFGSMPGFDMQFETFHIHEEARGFNQLLQAGAFTGQDRAFLVDADQVLAHDWPLQEGHPWPHETLTLKPNHVMTYEEMLVELSRIMADVIPSPAFMRQYRNLAVTRRYNEIGNGHVHT
jgi:hypothetical protein